MALWSKKGKVAEATVKAEGPFGSPQYKQGKRKK